ncbi:MAG: energy transducer TonB [Alphaproteobacteria bacterium]|nr:energy transducer TonB [Alphaproteobacteria bacterium]
MIEDPAVSPSEIPSSSVSAEVVLLHGGLRRPFVRTRRLGAAASSVFGMALVFGLVTLLNADGPKKEAAEGRPPVEVSVAPKPPKPPEPRRSRPPPPARPRANPPPTPNLASSLAGLDMGLPGFGPVGLDDLSGGLLGDVSDVVMTEDAVDAPPQPVNRAAPAYPPRARAKGITGFVTLNLRVGFDGRVEDARVVEAQPKGVFEQPALEAVRQWTFRPATYEGRPVTVRVRQTLRFELE